MILEFENSQEIGEVAIMRGVIGKDQLLRINHQCSTLVISIGLVLLWLIEEFHAARLPH